MLKNIFRRLLIKILKPFVKCSIIFESVPDFSDNTMSVYNEMLQRGMNKKYHFIWEFDYSKRFAYFDKKGDVHFFNIKSPKGIKENILHISYFDKAKCGICCNSFLDKLNRDEKLFYLGHGGPYKATKGYYSIPPKIDYTISMADFLNPIITDQHNYDVNKIVGLGYPRNDILVNSNFDSKSVFEKNI